MGLFRQQQHRDEVGDRGRSSRRRHHRRDRSLSPSPAPKNKDNMRTLRSSRSRSRGRGSKRRMRSVSPTTKKRDWALLKEDSEPLRPRSRHRSSDGQKRRPRRTSRRRSRSHSLSRGRRHRSASPAAMPMRRQSSSPAGSAKRIGSKRRLKKVISRRLKLGKMLAMSPPHAVYFTAAPCSINSLANCSQLDLRTVRDASTVQPASIELSTSPPRR